MPSDQSLSELHWTEFSAIGNDSVFTFAAGGPERVFFYSLLTQEPIFFFFFGIGQLDWLISTWTTKNNLKLTPLHSVRELCKDKKQGIPNEDFQDGCR